MGGGSEVVNVCVIASGSGFDSRRGKRYFLCLMWSHIFSRELTSSKNLAEGIM